MAGLYERFVLPRLIDRALGTPPAALQRELTLAPAIGRTLEIGFGTGLNLPHYPASVTHLTVIDSVSMLPKRVEARINEARMPVHRVTRDASLRLPADNDSFDAVVTTWTLCSINNLDAALKEICRVLKPEGIYLFLEHGRSDDPAVARRQDFVNPLFRCFGRGCNINRRIDRFLLDSGLAIRQLDRFVMPHAPRVASEMYRGIACRNA